jgi:phospholipase/carboxylesterase
VRLLTALSTVTLVLAACSRESERTQTQTQTQAPTKTQTTMETRTITLGAREPPPTHLVVFLHGVGADAQSFQDVAQSIAPAIPHADLVVPDGFHPWDGGSTGRQWFSLRGIDDANRPTRVREGGEEVSRWIDAELAKRELARDRLAIVGFSQGAMLTAWLATHRSPRPAAAVMLSGRVAEDRSPDADGGAVPVLIAHGDRDPLIAVDVVEPGARVLQTWGARVTTRVYPGLAHHVSSEELSDAAAFLKAALEKP